MSPFDLIIVQPIFNALMALYGLIPGGDFGIAVIIFTIIVRLLMWPLIKKQLQQSDYKNIKRLGDAHQKLLEKHPDLGLILVGRINKSAQMTKEYFEKKEYKNIHFTGFVEDDQRDWLFENCEAYVFPSLMEGFGLPPLEAMQYDAPVVSSNASCMPEVLGEAAEYFTPTDIDSMARAIDRVLTNPALRETLIENGRRQREKYSWRKMAQETLDQYTIALQES